MSLLLHNRRLRRSISNADLRGFHTPHGGSTSDLTELSSTATDGDYGGVGMGPLLAAAAALEPGGAEFPAAGTAATGGGGEGGGRELRRPSQENVAPSDWSVGPGSPAESGIAADAPTSAAAAAAAGGSAAAEHRRAEISPAAATTSSPVMSLSGHLISPEMRRGEGGAEMKKWARDAFMKEAVTWEHFSRYPQVCMHCTAEMVVRWDFLLPSRRETYPSR